MFPLFILGRFFVKLPVAVIPAGLNVPGLGGLAQGAARLFPVGAVMELEWLAGRKRPLTYQDRLRAAIDTALANRPADFPKFLSLMEQEVKLSKNLGAYPAAMVPEAGMSFEMEKYMKRVNPEFAYPVSRVLELNPEHETVKQLVELMTADPVKAKDYAQLLCYQAQLMAQLPIEDPYAYTELVCKLVK
jgi:hypothetical protein